MNKDMIKTAIAEQLIQIGLTPIMDENADITVDAELMDAKWATGQKKIAYHCSAYFDEESQSLNYWESSLETGAGLSFGASSETSTQSGTTLMRKVKSIQYGPDGKAYEYSFDLGQIPQMFKHAAKENNWKFKMVLKKEKAMFPGSNQSEPKVAQGSKEPLGLTKKPNLRFAKFIGVGILAIALIVVAIVLIKPGDNNQGNTDDQTAGNITETSKNYQDMGYSFSVYPSAVDLSDYSTDYYSHNLNLVCSLYQDVMVTEDSNDPDGSDVQEIRLSDFELTGGPELGEFSGILGGTFNSLEVITGTVEDGELVLGVSQTSAKYSQWSGSIIINFNIDDVTTYTYPAGATTTSYEISYQNAGIQSDDLRFGIRYKIEMITKSGKTYARTAEVQALEGDFLYDSAQAIVDTRTFDPATYKPFIE
jgi:hypothetical protein